ncbi:hypothetical protein ACHQM5_015972 [Ranunculus cassubicifolius]
MASTDNSMTKMPLEVGLHDRRMLSPLASHEDVVKNPRVFSDTLKSFHSALGTIINTPVIGGKELDLHLLYVEVTNRGGFDKVMGEKKWREIRTAFDFPSTATSASYVLKKQYLSVLRQYEQVYFLKKKISLITQASPVASFRPAIADIGEPASNPVHMGQTKQKKGSELSTVMGEINGKFEHGYLVTVTVGSEIFHGVLYHPAQLESFSPRSSNNVVYVPNNPDPSSSPAAFPCNSDQPSRRKKRKRRHRDVDPARPKSSRSAYNFFFADKHNEFKALYPDREQNFTKMIGSAWNNLTHEERHVYQEIGNKDKQRYQMELKVYEERKVSLNDLTKT